MTSHIQRLFIAFALTTLFGCTPSDKAPDKNYQANADTSSANQQKAQPTATQDASADRSITMLKFDTAQAKTYQHIGTILGGARWSDRNGENTLIVSQRFTRPKERNDTRVQELYGYLYVTQGDSTRRLWMIQDQADNWCDEGHGLVSPIEVRDLDSDGVAENAFVYNVAGNCNVSPMSYKLMLHSGERKYAVRGTTRVFDGADSIGGEHRFDPAFDSSPGAYRGFASEMWDQYVKSR